MRLVLLLEKTFEVRHEAGRVLNALAGILHHEDIPRALANTIIASSALSAFNVLSLVQKALPRVPWSGSCWRLWNRYAERAGIASPHSPRLTSRKTL